MKTGGWNSSTITHTHTQVEVPVTSREGRQSRCCPAAADGRLVHQRHASLNIWTDLTYNLSLKSQSLHKKPKNPAAHIKQNTFRVPDGVHV